MIQGRNWVYYGIPKTGSTSFHKVLVQPKFGGKASGQQHDMPIQPDDILVMVSVRNPYSRAMSMWRHYLNECEPNPTFAEFMRLMIEKQLNPFFHNNQSEWLSKTRWDIPLRLEQWFHAIPHANKSYGRKTMTEVEAGLVRLWAGDDFKLLRYDTDPTAFLEPRCESN